MILVAQYLKLDLEYHDAGNHYQEYTSGKVIIIIMNHYL